MRPYGSAFCASVHERAGGEGATPDGTGSHGIAINTDAGPFTDPDGFTWEAA